MQTSDAPRSKSGSSKARALVGIVVFLLLAAVVNALLTLVFVPYGSKSEVAWTDYAAEDEIDTVAVGTSIAMTGVDPFTLDELLGTKSFNLATPSQLLDESYLAIRTAYEDHQISRAILCLSASQVMRSSDPNPGSAFMHQRSRVVTLRQQLEGCGYLLFDGGAITTPRSINMVFPWVSNKVSQSVGAVVANARMKLDGTSLYEAAEVNERGWTYKGKGYGYHKSKLDFNGSKVESYFAMNNPEDMGVEAERASELDAGRERALRDLCSYCADHGIELFVFAPPMPDFTLVEYGEDYVMLGERLRGIVESYGARYFDMNFAQVEVLARDESFFHDSTHLTVEGAEAFTTAIARVVQGVQVGEDVGRLFMTWDERMAGIDRISAVFVSSAVEADGVHAVARSMAGPAVRAEYQYLRNVGDEWVVLRDWSDDPTFVFVPDGGERGSFELCVSARKAGSDVEYDRYRKFTVLY